MAWPRSEVVGSRGEARCLARPHPAKHQAVQRRRCHAPGLRRPALRTARGRPAEGAAGHQQAAARRPLQLRHVRRPRDVALDERGGPHWHRELPGRHSLENGVYH
eukprot:366494-Pyramimonas_sp.AAC.1